ncbi:MAG TPA: potassium transporter TrkG, partial [Opitutales bacterium]|nr:potassium transporter TrkG [Opitutales bacterium]
AVLALIGAVAAGILVYTFGWPPKDGMESLLYDATSCLLFLFGVCELMLLALAPNRLTHIRENLTGILVALAALAVYLGSDGIREILLREFGHGSLEMGLMGFIIVTQVAVLGPLLLRWLRHGRRTWMTLVQPRSLVIGSFLTLILSGALLLMTPNATTSPIRFIDALFTSTSAVCVTGLTSLDTATVFTRHGQLAILLLIQAGGLGLMTFTYFLAMLAGEGISLHDRVLLREVVSEKNMGHISRVLLEIVVVTLMIEAAGAVLIFNELASLPVPPPDLVWHSVFHAVSAFCNAGFSTFSGNLADPVVRGLRGMQAVVMILVITGGLGFPVLRELRQRFLSRLFPRSFERPSHMTLHTRLVLRMTILLLFGGTAAIYACQYVGQGPLEPSLWRAAFDSVGARTAGFNIEDVGAYSVSVALILIFLMFIGGSPSGTAGGVKTTTFALALLNLWTIVREKKEIQVGWRSVGQRTANQAFAVIVISLIWLALATFAMTVAEPALRFIDLFFETVSAFGTVGLSRGITALLNDPGKIIIILTMFIGRIGLIVIATALLHAPHETRYNFPKEEVGLT